VSAFADVDADNVVIDTVKRHEDSNALIVRLYEAFGQRGNATVTFGTDVKSISECDLMEENDVPVKLKGNSATLYMTPYEIRTLKLTLK
jgi:alpha-mannosidase